jgi:adenylate cyclase
LRPKTFDTLVYLVTHAGQLVPKEHLLEAVWPETVVSEGVLKNCIAELRKVLGETAQMPQYIATVSRRGYRFMAPVTVVLLTPEGSARTSSPCDPAETPAPQPLGSNGGHLADDETTRTLASLSKQAEVPMAFPDPTSVVSPPPVIADRPSLVVLPFLPLSDERACEYAADGLTEDITTLLAHMPGFFVIARSSAFVYKGQIPDVRQIGRELGVRYVVEGSVRPLGGHVRVTAQLIDAETGTHVWAEQFEATAEADFDVHDRVVRGIVAQLEPALTRAEVTRLKRQSAHPADSWAYYRQAYGVLSLHGWHENTFSEAAALLRQAIVVDENFALAHALLALVLGLGHRFGLSRERDAAMAEALREGERALRLDSQSSEVLGYVGCAFSDLGEPTRGMTLLERAVEYDPSNAQARVALGTALLLTGNAKGAVERLRQGIRLSPRDPRLAVWGGFLALGLAWVGHLDEAIAEARLACRRDDQFYPARVILAAVLAKAGWTQDTAAALRDARRIRPHLSVAEVHALIGQRATDSLRQAGLLEGFASV